MTGIGLRVIALEPVLAAIAASDTAGPGPDDIGFEWYREKYLADIEEPAAATPLPGHCDFCGYKVTAIGHQVTCGDLP